MKDLVAHDAGDGNIRVPYCCVAPSVRRRDHGGAGDERIEREGCIERERRVQHAFPIARSTTRESARRSLNARVRRYTRIPLGKLHVERKLLSGPVPDVWPQLYSHNEWHVRVNVDVHRSTRPLRQVELLNVGQQRHFFRSFLRCSRHRRIEAAHRRRGPRVGTTGRREDIRVFFASRELNHYSAELRSSGAGVRGSGAPRQ